MAGNKIIAVLDLGSTKICCFIAEVTMADHMRIIGIGHNASDGLCNGVIIDMEAAHKAMVSAINNAEKMAETTISHIYVSVNGVHIHSQRIWQKMEVSRNIIRENDINRLLQSTCDSIHSGERTFIHAIPTGYNVDDGPLLHNPVGMYARMLGVHMHLVTANTATVQNLINCVARCHLKTEGTVLSAYASGLSTLVPDEKEMGTMVVDMGGSTTSLCSFYHGEAIYTHSIPIGGRHITSDIAQGLSTPLASAERLKTLYGSCIPASSDDTMSLDVPQVGEQTGEDGEMLINQVSKNLLTSIIRARAEETFELLKDKIQGAGMAELAGHRVVLTGGASQLSGVRELATDILERQVRCAKAHKIEGMAESTSGPAFSAAAGLLLYALNSQGDAKNISTYSAHRQSNFFIRIGHWFRDNF